MRLSKEGAPERDSLYKLKICEVQVWGKCMQAPAYRNSSSFKASFASMHTTIAVVFTQTNITVEVVFTQTDFKSK